MATYALIALGIAAVVGCFWIGDHFRSQIIGDESAMRLVLLYAVSLTAFWKGAFMIMRYDKHGPQIELIRLVGGCISMAFALVLVKAILD